MTPEKAIELFRERLTLPDYREQIPEYYEAMELAVKTLEKQIPKEAIRKILDNDLRIGRITFKRGTKIYHCPSCRKFITGSDEHCRWCGQVVDFADAKARNGGGEMIELPKEEYLHYEKDGHIVTVCTMRQKALHVIGLNQIRNKRRLYTRHGKKYYKPYRNYFDAPQGGDRDLEMLSKAGYMDRTITHAGTDREGVWYSFNRKGLDWLGEQIGVHIYDEDE